jgi:hypothetical protein
MDVMRRLAASVALLALLVCSSAGTCWVQIAGTSAGHDCCPEGSGDTMAGSAQACASTIAPVVPVDLAPPSAAATTLLASPASPLAIPIEAFAPGFPILRPPLILRI